MIFRKSLNQKMNNPEGKKHPLAYAGLVLKISFSLLLPIFVGIFLGTYLDKLLGTSPWLVLLLLILGIASGFGWLYKISTKSDGY